MQFQAKDFDPTTLRTGCLAVGIYEKGELSEAASKIDKAGNGALSDFIGQERFSGKAGTTQMLHHSVGQNAQRLLLVGLGKPGGEGITPADFVTIVKSLVPHAKATNARDMSLSLAGIDIKERGKDWAAHQLAQQLTQGLWQYDQTKSQKAPKPALKKLTLGDTRKAVTALKQGLKTGQAVGDGANYARELGNLPGNICTPRYLAKQARALGRGEKELSVSVLSEKQMRELGMGSFLSVSAGSTEPGHMIVMEYRGAAKSQAPTALVGKGITFDTGGISLKPGAAMDEMKFDMCGAASVFGAMKALMALKPKINVVAVVAAAENMPAGNATKPGDIVTSMSGQTIEILNTDAEGRLVLCDALTYTKRYKPKAVVDIATLTGACVMALGSHAHGLYSNDDTLASELLAAGQSAEDKGWQMPLWDDYQKQLDSNFADMANIGGREAGSVTAACFLSRFTKEMRWAHLDVAGTAWNSGAAKGATGRPVPMLVNYLLENG